MAELARQATESFIDAQKKLADVAGQQLNSNLKTAGKAMELLTPFPSLPLAELTREGVKSYVDAQKALMDVLVKSANPNTQPRPYITRSGRCVRPRSTRWRQQLPSERAETVPAA